MLRLIKSSSRQITPICQMALVTCGLPPNYILAVIWPVARGLIHMPPHGGSSITVGPAHSCALGVRDLASGNQWQLLCIAGVPPAQVHIQMDRSLTIQLPIYFHPRWLENWGGGGKMTNVALSSN